MQEKGYKFSYRINAKHNITPQKLEAAHSHTFYIYLYVEFKNKDFINTKIFNDLLIDFFKKYSGKDLNSIYPFEELPPTIENMAYTFYTNLKPLFKEKDSTLLCLELGDSPFGLFSISEGENSNNIVYPNLLIDDILELKNDIL